MNKELFSNNPLCTELRLPFDFICKTSLPPTSLTPSTYGPLASSFLLSIISFLSLLSGKSFPNECSFKSTISFSIGLKDVFSDISPFASFIVDNCSSSCSFVTSFLSPSSPKTSTFFPVSVKTNGFSPVLPAINSA